VPSSSCAKIGSSASNSYNDYDDDDNRDSSNCRSSRSLVPKTGHDIGGDLSTTIKFFLGLTSYLAMKNRERENIRVVRRFVREVFNAGRVDVLDEIAAMNWKDNGNRAPAEPGRNGWKKRTLATHASFPDIHMTVDDIFGLKDKVVIRYTVEGSEKTTSNKKGKRFRASGITIARLKNGRFQENWNHFDELMMMRQLGKIK
jgi:predicted ester cyclase